MRRKGGGVYRTSFARKRTREKRRYAHAKAAGRVVGCRESLERTWFKINLKFKLSALHPR